MPIDTIILEILTTGKEDGESNGQLVRRLFDEGQIQKDELKMYQFIAGAADYYDNNSWMHVENEFADPFDAIEFLRKNRTDGNGLAYLTQALWAGGKIPKGKFGDYQFTGSAADYYDKNVWMHVENEFADPFDAIEFLRKNRTDGNSLAYLTSALWTGGKIPKDELKHYQFAVGAADYYDKNVWMHVEKPFTNPFDVVNFLRDNKVDDNSLGYLTQALWTGGKIPKDELKHYQFAVGAAEYALANQDMIEEQIRKAKDQVKFPNNQCNYKQLKNAMDRTLFTYRNDPTKEISNVYFNDIMRFAMELYGNKIIGK